MRKTNMSKKCLGLTTLALGVALLAPGVSQAFTSKTIIASTATATVTGGSAAMSIAILNAASGLPATNVTWNVAAGSYWTLASQYIQIASTLTLSGAGIQTYTNNTILGAVPRYTGAVSSATSAGLVNESTTTQVLPLAWQISASTFPAAAVADPNCTGATGEPSYCAGQPQSGYAWFYYADEANGALQNAPANWYIQPEQAGSPPQIQFAQGPSFGAGAANGKNNLFLEALFSNGLGGVTYQTSELTLQLFTQ